jgi:hypothetical protein
MKERSASANYNIFFLSQKVGTIGFLTVTKPVFSIHFQALYPYVIEINRDCPM